MNLTRRLIISTALCWLALAGAVQAENATRYIDVIAKGKLNVKPDIVRFSFAISERGDNLSELKRLVDRKTAKIVALCKEAGVEKKDLISAEVSLYPQYDYKSQRLTGYTVSRNIRATLRDLERYSALLNGAVDAGVNNINNITLDVENRDKLRNDALGSAIVAARKKAGLFADNAGVELGEVLSIAESGAPLRQRRYLYRESNKLSLAADADGDNVQGAFEPGEIVIESSVSMRFAIE